MARSSPRAKEAQAQWRVVERVVALLEKVVSPDAKVEHDAELCEIVTGTPRQCDVAITFGRPPRQFVAIVEVQKRGRRVELAQYQGWLQKKEALGVAMLICVSMKGFPESVRKDAASRGPMVKLVTLREIEEGCWPIGIEIGRMRYREVSQAIESVHADIDAAAPKDVPDGGRLAVKFSDAVYTVSDRDGPLDLHQLINIDGLVVRYLADKSPGQHPVDFHFVSNADRRFGVLINGAANSVKSLLIRLIWTVVDHELLPKVYAYEPLEVGDKPIWIIRGTGLVEDRDVEFRYVLRPDTDGLLRVHAEEVEGLEDGTILYQGL